MRTNIVIDDQLMQAAMSGSEFKTKREAVEEGLRILARRNHYREILKWEGKLHWDDQPSTEMAPAVNQLMESTPKRSGANHSPATFAAKPASIRRNKKAVAKA